MRKGLILLAALLCMRVRDTCEASQRTIYSESRRQSAPGQSDGVRSKPERFAKRFPEIGSVPPKQRLPFASGVPVVAQKSIVLAAAPENAYKQPCTLRVLTRIREPKDFVEPDVNRALWAGNVEQVALNVKGNL